jgi:hypothetical protein
VEVIDRQTVAGMEATILRATDAEKLREWLNRHGYEARPALTEWLKVYVDQGWYLTAFQYKKPENASRGLTARAVRISFATDRPFYPYREPADSRANKSLGSRTLRVFFASTKRVTGTLGERGAWPGETVWSAPLAEAQTALLRQNLTDPRPVSEHGPVAVQLPETVWLTEFVDRSSPRPGTDEVSFQESTDQSVLKRPAEVTYDVRPRINPRELTAVSLIGAALMLGVGFFTLRYLRSPATPDSDGSSTD